MSENHGPHWVAFVVCHVPESNEVGTSFLAFYARNRFQALNYVKSALPYNPSFLDSNGNIRPHHILAMHQCAPSEVREYAHMYFEDFLGATSFVPVMP